MVCIASSFVRQQLIYECHALVIRGRFISRQITTRHYYFLSRHCFGAAVVATTLIRLRTVQRTTPSYIFNRQRESQDLFLMDLCSLVALCMVSAQSSFFVLQPHWAVFTILFQAFPEMFIERRPSAWSH